MLTEHCSGGIGLSNYGGGAEEIISPAKTNRT